MQTNNLIMIKHYSKPNTVWFLLIIHTSTFHHTKYLYFLIWDGLFCKSSVDKFTWNINIHCFTSYTTVRIEPLELHPKQGIYERVSHTLYMILHVLCKYYAHFWIYYKRIKGIAIAGVVNKLCATANNNKNLLYQLFSNRC